MRLKTFTATSMAEAMDMVRSQLGEDAIIVSTAQGRGDGRVEITAAVETDSPDDYATPEAQALREHARYGANTRGFVPAEDFGTDVEAAAFAAEFADLLHGALSWHGVPARLAERLTQAALRVGLEDMPGALAEALDEHFRFPGLSMDNRPVLLVGPPGAGKSIAVAKIAARGVLERRNVHVISCDLARAAAGEQLAALCRVMAVPFTEAADGRELTAMMAHTGEAKIVIDTTGLNPFQPKERGPLKELIEASGAEPLLVLPAGGDPGEAAEVASIFAGLGCRRFLPTRLDASRRLGGLLAAADAAGLAFADAGCSPFVGKGFERLDPLQLAHWLLRDPDSGVSANLTSKAAE